MSAPRSTLRPTAAPRLALSIALVLAAPFPVPTPAHAQGNPQSVATVRVDVDQVATGFRSSKIVGSAVYNDAGDSIGRVDDLIVTPSDRVLYAVISVGGFLGVGDHLVVVPYSALSVTPKRIVAPGATKEALRALPAFKYS